MVHISLVQLFAQRETVCKQTATQIHYIRLAHIARTTTTGNKLIGGRTEEGNLLCAIERQGVVVVFEQHKTLACNLACESCVSFEVWVVRVLVTIEAW